MRLWLSILLFIVITLGASCQRARTVSFEPESAAAAPSAGNATSLHNTPELFDFADDHAGKLLAKSLTPAGPNRLPTIDNSGPKTRAGSTVGTLPDLLPSPPRLSIPNLPVAKGQALRPHMLAESTPLAHLHDDPQLPARPGLPVSALISQASADANTPIPLAAQSQPRRDRASLDDPTADFSAAQAKVYSPPLRSAPVPFQRLDLPEPFGHRRPVKPLDAEPQVVSPVPSPPSRGP